jgi:hypothetical protein
LHSAPTVIRSADRRLDSFERLIFPKLGERWIESIKRSDIKDLTNGIAENRDKRTAERH